jgi:phosphorylcholine metabolism protein LicD
MIRKDWRSMKEQQKKSQMLLEILRMTKTDDIVFNYLMLARVAAKESRVQDAENHYVEGLTLLEQKRRTKSTKDIAIGYLTMKAEYLSFQVPKSIYAGEISKARGLGMDALT